MFPGNCVLIALWHFARAPRSTRLRWKRNRYGRLHCYWQTPAGCFEFHAPHRSTRAYLWNTLYFGRVREIPQHRPAAPCAV